MPTAPKLASLIAFALLSYFAALSFGKLLPEGAVLGYLPEYSAGIGGLVGWFVMGRDTGKGYGTAIGSGIRTQVIAIFAVLLVFSIYLMIKKSTHMMYDGPMEAVLGIFDFMLDYGKKMVDQDFILVILGGGSIAGIMAEWAGKRWS